MTIEAQVLTVYDGGLNATLQLTGRSDGQGGQETNELKVDLSALAGSYQAKAASVRIDEVEFVVQGGTQGGYVKLLWDAPTPVEFLQLNGVGEFTYWKEGGLQNIPKQADPSVSGNILLSTINFGQDSTYSIVLKLRKKYA
jgi:hypothetical protein